MGSYSSGGEILPKQCSFVPHFRGSFSWLGIGSNTNIAIFVPLEVLEAGVIPWEATTKDPILYLSPFPGELFKTS